ncbi:MAG: CARDB domain-containing protein, partial [Candidatus Thermoplasmatota archaeon]
MKKITKLLSLLTAFLLMGAVFSTFTFARAGNNDAEVAPDQGEGKRRLSETANKSDRFFRSPYEEVNWNNIDYYSGNFHTHTTESDGDYDPSEAIDMYKKEGYDALALTDHNTQTWGETTYPWTDYGRDPDELNMVAVEGNEISTTHHINSLFNDYKGLTFSEDEVFQGIGEKDGLAVFNHPSRYDETVEWYVDFYRKYDHILGQEIYNKDSKDDIGLYDNIVHETLPERPVWLYGNDDMHDESDFGWNRNIFLLENLTKENVRESLESGSTYLWIPNNRTAKPNIEIADVENTGDSIDLTIDGDVTEVNWITYNPDSQQSEVVHQGFNISTNDTLEDCRFVRAEIESPEGKIYTQPFSFVTLSLESPEPAEGAEQVPLNSTLSVDVYSENHPTQVDFYLEGSPVYSEKVGENKTVETGAVNLKHGTTYNWTVEATDDQNKNRTITSVYSFTTFKEAYFDVSITSPAENESYFKGEQVLVNYTVMNTGDEADTQNITFYVDNEVEGSEENVKIEANETYKGVFTWNTSGAETGERELKIASGNDSDMVLVRVLERAHFLVDITGYDEEVTQGAKMNLEYEVNNTGDVPDTQDIVFKVKGSEESVYQDLTLQENDTHQGIFTW